MIFFCNFNFWCCYLTWARSISKCQNVLVMTVTNNYVTLCLIQTLQSTEFTPIYSTQYQVRVLHVIYEKIEQPFNFILKWDLMWDSLLGRPLHNFPIQWLSRLRVNYESMADYEGMACLHSHWCVCLPTEMKWSVMRSRSNSRHNVVVVRAMQTF